MDKDNNKIHPIKYREAVILAKPKLFDRVKNSEKGVSLIMAFFIMIIILSVVLAVSTILYSEVKVIRNINNSIVSFYAADSGIEKVLFYDRQVVPVIGQDKDRNDIFAPRGLCAMLANTYPNYCLGDDFPNDPNVPDHSIYCNGPAINPLAAGGCDVNTCTNCKITFDTSFDDRTYSVEASVVPNQYLDVKSNGAFKDTGRQIEIFVPTQQ